MSNLKTRISEFLLSAQLIIENASSDTMVKKALAGFGYAEEKFMAGQKLYDEASQDSQRCITLEVFRRLSNPGRDYSNCS